MQLVLVPVPKGNEVQDKWREVEPRGSVTLTQLCLICVDIQRIRGKGRIRVERAEHDERAFKKEKEGYKKRPDKQSSIQAFIFLPDLLPRKYVLFAESSPSGQVEDARRERLCVPPSHVVPKVPGRSKSNNP